MWLLAICIVALFVVVCYKYCNDNSMAGVLPPGSMGLPFIGETFQLLIPGRSLDIHPFIKTRIQKYGPIFKTKIAGRPVVVSADPKANRFLFLQEGRLVEVWYLDSLSKYFALEGDSRLSEPGAVHHYLRNLLLNHFGSETIRDALLPQMGETIRDALSTWAGQNSIEVKQSTSKIIFEFSAKLMFGYDKEKDSLKFISESLTSFLEVLMSFPVYIPGTKFYKCMQERKKMMNVIREKLREKISSGRKTGKGDLLDQAIEDMGGKKFLKEEFLVQLMFTVLVASFESVSTVLTLALKLLSENSSARNQLIAEHKALQFNSWTTGDEYKSMTFTSKVIKETLRMTNTLPGLLRRATKDFQVNGYTIPAFWTIMIASSAQQLNPQIFDEPLVFDPWRWDEVDANVITNNFMPFGGGMRQCAGAEFSKVFMSLFLHILSTEYEWELMKQDNITRTPLLNLGEGIQIKVVKK